MVYRYCIVPNCKSTTISTPEKTFIKLPNEETQRKIWLKAIRRQPEGISLKSHVYLCEDHFNLEQDMENYMEWKIMRVQKRMKKNVVPHIFAFQEDRVLFGKRNQQSEQMVVVKRARQSIIQDILCETSASIPELPTREDIPPIRVPHIKVEKNMDRLRTVGIQVNLRNEYQSKSVQCNFPQKTTGQVASPVPPVPVLSRVKLSSVKRVSFSSSESTVTGLNMSSTSSNTTSISSDSELDEVINRDNKKTVLKLTIQKMKANPRLYLGISNETLFITDIIQTSSQVNVDNIYLILQKIRLDKTFQELADDFGMSRCRASTIFVKKVGPISNTLNKLIGWFPIVKVKKCLPLAFQASYCNVYTIIDCLEIEIQKPEDPVRQTLTWSEYKKANTMKYLISSTPDGLVNFISNGFGGGTSDALVVEKSGFLEKLQPNMYIMAKRGFKHIDYMLGQKKCKLLRPQRVASGSKLSKEEALQTKKIASLRFHIEQVIRRLREFKILGPNTCIDIQLIPHLDYIMNIACALVNIQGPLISWKQNNFVSCLSGGLWDE